MQIGILIPTNDSETARQSEGSDLCPISALKDIHGIIRESEKSLTF
jgi:hypothetical protein